jgi:CDP-diacylglycerol--glycerol-3-phosphate 3-phosphatidyltransferase
VSAVAVVLLGLLFWGANPTAQKIVAIVYLVAALSDLLDGYLARKYHNESNLGRFLDPMADKLLVISALLMLIPAGRVPAWVAFLIIARELAVTSLRAIAVEKGLVIAASAQGKQKTLAQNIALFCLLWNSSMLWANTVHVGAVILYVALFATYWSGAWYFVHFFRAAKLASGGGGLTVMNATPPRAASPGAAPEKAPPAPTDGAEGAPAPDGSLAAALEEERETP